MRLSGSNLPLLVILGPTAVGKTGLAIDIARALDGEIVGADSRQVYRYMDIGTAKPTPEQQALVKHHLVDVVNPDENLSLADYQRMTYAAIGSIHAKGKLPLLVGGTGQYITAIVEGWSIPEVRPDEALRLELEAYAAQNGAEALHQRLVAHDPVYAEKVHPNNVRRVVRALEVCLVSGQRFSDLQKKQPPPYRIRTYGLTLPLEKLYERAYQRVDMMMESGFLEEVKQLLEMGYPATLPSMSGLGYAQLAAYLNGQGTLQEAIEHTKSATHAFIRRQYTWFRGHDHGILWHNAVDLDTRALIDETRNWQQHKA